MSLKLEAKVIELEGTVRALSDQLNQMLDVLQHPLRGSTELKIPAFPHVLKQLGYERPPKPKKKAAQQKTTGPSTEG